MENCVYVSKMLLTLLSFGADLHLIVSNLTFENGFSGIIYTLFRERQNIFSTIASFEIVVKCATNILKIGQKIKILCAK